MKIVTFQLEDLTCPSCIERIKRALNSEKGIIEANVAFSSSKVRVTLDENKISAENVGKIIQKLGYEILGLKQ